MKLLLKIIAAPVIVALTLFVWLCSAILYCSAYVLGLVGSLLGLLAHSGDRAGFCEERAASFVGCLFGQSARFADGGSLAAGQSTGCEVRDHRRTLLIDGLRRCHFVV